MGAVLVRTLLDYWAPADISSVAELVAHLDGACSHAGLAALLDIGLGERVMKMLAQIVMMSHQRTT